MKQISLWAKLHTTSARILITIIHVLLVLLAVYKRSVFQQLPSPVFIISAIVLVILFIVYPRKKNSAVKNMYALKKATEFAAAVCFFIMICWFSNHHFQLPFIKNNVLATVVKPAGNKPTAQEILQSLKYRDKSTLTRNEKRILRKEFTKQLGVYAKATLQQDKPAQASALAIILTIIVAVGLLYLLAALSCNISCSGSGTLAVIVLILGVAGVAIGAYYIINGSRKHRQKMMERK